MLTESYAQIQVTEDTSKTGKQKASTMPTKNSTRSQVPTNTLILQSRNNTFQTKMLELREKVHLKIGRQISSKTPPGPLNGYFDSKVLSRAHAELWSDKGKVYIKDVKSSNGTFLNSLRLSPENEESVPIELQTGDELEFGIDITNDDGSVLYHKVACDVHLFSTPLSQVDTAITQELNMPMSNGYSQGYSDIPKLQRKSSSCSVSSVSTISSANDINVSAAVPPTTGKRSRHWELLLTKLQGELQRAKEVGNELASMKESVLDVDKIFNEDKLKKSDEHNILLQQQLAKSAAQLASYAEKCRQQERALLSANQELHNRQQTIRAMEKEGYRNDSENNRSETKQNRWQSEEAQLEFEKEKIRLNKALVAKEVECIDLKSMCIELEKQNRRLEKIVNGQSSSKDLAGALQV
ncbi:hypothetical protein J3Q64DRAFT_1729310 [Phycomyces blakesleeanus]|uniref:FHA domain-containing protein n=1 Tax=Phycomyces blakesleeanus TaxID=4837 RepID=A0ABR3B4Y0_PHYBL